jgi:methionyl aminopeptidase
MREAGAIVRECLELAARMVAPGVTTAELDAAIEAHIRARGAEPAFKGYAIPSAPCAYPASSCISVNEEVVHGIPGRRKLREGDIVGVDIGTIFRGYHGDAARTFPVGRIAEPARKLLAATRAGLDAGVAAVRPGGKVSDISRAVQQVAEAHGYGIVRQFVGHGIGRRLHEDPQIPNYVPPEGPDQEWVLRPGVVLAIEPMFNLGGDDVETLADGWTVVTRDRTLSAHFENSVAVTVDGREVLTEVMA